MVGGTFDPFHEGHRTLLRRTFMLAGNHGKVFIGLTTDAFAARKSHPVRPYEKRETTIIQFIREQEFAADWIIEPISDRYGSAIDANYDALVVSEETLPVAMEINRLRQKKKKRKVDIHQISCVLADDGRWISSTRIWRGEIDPQGHVLQK